MPRRMGSAEVREALQRRPSGRLALIQLHVDLGFKDGQYNLVVTIFFIPFVLFAPPFAMLAKKFGPARSLPVMTLVFGSMTLATAAAQNFGTVFALRWFLGMAEAAFLPTAIYYLTMFYRRSELARRLAIFYAASSVASGFSGLLAFGIFRIRSGISAWRYLFVVEGAGTVFFAAFAYWYLPRSAAEASFLDDGQRVLAFHRVQVDSSSMVHEKFSLRESLAIFTYPTSFVFLAIELCVGLPLQSVALFLPQIVERLGYSTVKTNLFTVAPNATGAAMLLILAFCSDWTRLRFPFLVIGFVFTFIGFIIYASIDHVETRLNLAYSATFMMCWGSSAPSVILSAWYNNNIAHEGRRVTLTSVGVPLANAMGLVAGSIFRQADAPLYLPALITAASFGAAGALISACLGLYMILDNKRRDRRAGVHIDARDITTQRLREGPSVEEFRWFL